jgi:hypothetical protein
MAGSVGFEVRVRVRGTLDPAWWSARFADLAIVPEGDGTTLRGVLTDQAAVHGLLAAIRDTGLSLLSVETAATTETTATAPDDHSIDRTRGDAP